METESNAFVLTNVLDVAWIRTCDHTNVYLMFTCSQRVNKTNLQPKFNNTEQFGGFLNRTE